MDIPDEFGSLFDDAVQVAPLQARASTQQRAEEWDLDVTSGFATMAGAADLHEEPEPALPTTDGAEEEPTEEDAHTAAQRLLAALNPVPQVPYRPPVRQAAQRPVQRPAEPARPQPPAETPEERGRRLLAYVDASLSGQEVDGPNPFSHLLAGQNDNEIAAAAQRALANPKVALKTYDLAERNEIINEGEGTTAANLDRLDISGTHYEALEAAQAKREAATEDEDLWMLDGDPNGAE